MSNPAIAVIGHGYWGSKVFEEYVALRGGGLVDEVHVCDIDSDRIAPLGAADGTSTSTEETIHRVDAVHVCTHNTTHYEIAKVALENDTDVLLEKPLTTNRRTAFDLVEIASQYGRILQTGHIFRFANAIREVKSIVDQGRLGDVYYFDLRWTHRIDPIRDTDVLWDLLCHPIDILNFVSGSWPTAAAGYARSHRRESGSESAQIYLQFPGATAGIQVSWVDPVRRRLLEVVGSEGSVIVECVDQTIQTHDGDSVELIEVDRNNTIRAEAENFLQAIKTNKNAYNSAIVGARTVDAIEMVEGALEES